jgi:uncharacterized membrane protein
MRFRLRRSEWWALAVIAASVVASIGFYPILPESVPSHWNAAGEVDGFLPRGWGVALMPLIALVMLVLFVVVPRIDPKRENIEKFRNHFDNFIVLLFVFLAYLHILTLFAGAGYSFNLVRFLAPAFAFLFWQVGTLVAHAEPNWTVGIRTPWTLSSESVWRKTHALSGKLFRTSGSIALLGVFFPSVAIWLVVVPAIASALTAFVYSYVLFKREARV